VQDSNPTLRSHQRFGLRPVRFGIEDGFWLVMVEISCSFALQWGLEGVKLLTNHPIAGFGWVYGSFWFSTRRLASAGTVLATQDRGFATGGDPPTASPVKFGSRERLDSHTHTPPIIKQARFVGGGEGVKKE
jgi:hypothetical protein